MGGGEVFVGGGKLWGRGLCTVLGVHCEQGWEGCIVLSVQVNVHFCGCGKLGPLSWASAAQGQNGVFPFTL